MDGLVTLCGRSWINVDDHESNPRLFKIDKIENLKIDEIFLVHQNLKFRL